MNKIEKEIKIGKYTRFIEEEQDFEKSEFRRIALDLSGEREVGLIVAIPFDTTSDMNSLCSFNKDDKGRESISFKDKFQYSGDILLIGKDDYKKLLAKSNKLRMLTKLTKLEGEPNE